MRAVLKRSTAQNVCRARQGRAGLVHLTRSLAHMDTISPSELLRLCPPLEFAAGDQALGAFPKKLS